VPARVARMSTTIRDLLEALPDSDGEAVPLSGVPPAIFAQVVFAILSVAVGLTSA